MDKDKGSTLSRAVHIDDEVNGRIAKTSVAYGRLCENVLVRSGTSGLTLNWKSTKLRYCQICFVHVRPGQCTDVTLKQHFHFKQSEKTPKDQVARQVPGPEDSRDAKHIYSSKVGTAKIDWPCHEKAWFASTKESILWRTTGGKTSRKWSEETL